MKNILFIVLDSITNDQIFNSSSSNLKVPFLTELRKKSITGNKMYAEAPYTEAALMSLLGSIDTLDDNGYMEKFKNKKTVIDVFNENGYETFFSTFYPSIYPKYMRYGAKDIRYIEKFTTTHFWDYRFEHYKTLYLNNETSEYENIMLENMFEDNLNAWIEYLNLLEKNSIETIMLNNHINGKTINLNKEKVIKERTKFLNNKSLYLKELFEKGLDHNLFKIDNQEYVDKIIDNDFREWFIKEYKDIFKKIYKTQIKYNIKNAKFPVQKFIKNIRNKEISKGLLAGYKNLIYDKDLFDRVNYNFDLFKSQRSFRTVIDETISYIEKNKNSKAPWMAYVHIDDAHYPENFFTYDTNDKSIIKEEFAKINEFVDSLPKNYCGTISSDLSLLYCDSMVKRIYEYLEINNLLDSTSIVITADHGFSYYFNPIREKYVISSYKENYNVPFIIFDKNIVPRNIEGYLQTKDIPSTLLDLANIKIPSFFKGKSLLKFDGRENSMVEYMGGGCPDIKRRTMILGIRDDSYEVITNIKNGEIKVAELYDVKKDPYENNNLYKKNIDISKYLKMIKERYDEIMKGVKY